MTVISPKNILLQILKETAEKNYSIGKTHLIKLFYLTEVEYFRETGERLTDLGWMFYHYGPYALELENVFQEKEFEKITKQTQTDREFIQFKVSRLWRDGSYQPFVDTKLSLLIKRIVGMWGSVELTDLLDYVYFETEPMQAVEKRGELLDFSTVKKENVEVVVPLKASKEAEQRVAELRKRIAPTLKKLAERRSVPEPETESYREAMRAWDEEETIDASRFAGLQRLKITIKPQANSDTQGH